MGRDHARHLLRRRSGAGRLRDLDDIAVGERAGNEAAAVIGHVDLRVGIDIVDREELIEAVLVLATLGTGQGRAAGGRDLLAVRVWPLDARDDGGGDVRDVDGLVLEDDSPLASVIGIAVDRRPVVAFDRLALGASAATLMVSVKMGVVAGRDVLVAGSNSM